MLFNFHTKKHSWAIGFHPLRVIYKWNEEKKRGFPVRRYFSKWTGKYPGSWLCVQFLWFTFAICRKP